VTDTIGQRDERETLFDDLATLSPTALRRKYQKESNCHANMRQRAAQGKCTVDPRWATFRNFLEDMGPCLIPGGSIDRIDNENRHYGPDLCRWASKKDQTRNRANTRWVAYEGEKMTLAEFVERHDLSYTTVHSALARGEDTETIVRRHTSISENRGRFVPGWADTDIKLEAFRRLYRDWVKEITRKDRKEQVSEQAYAVIFAALIYLEADRDLKRGGYSELLPHEWDEFAMRFEKQLRIQREALGWAQAATKALSIFDRDFALKLYPRDIAGLIEIARYDKWFREPPAPVYRGDESGSW
jgi:hypothetical protein